MTPGNEGGTERIRRDIDRGRTRDKVDVDDPAAAPLGTDDEAAGAPASPEEVALARANQPREDVPTDVNRSAPTRRRHALPPVVIAVLIGVGALIAAAALAWYALLP
jgi:hypothetical protein